MTRKTSLVVLLMLLTAGSAVAAMSGTYTVKKDSTGDFTSVYAAGQALSSQTTGGNVVIEIYDGDYNDGYIYLYYVNQTRPDDTITFRPASGSKVTIRNGGSSYVFYSYYTNNVKIEDMDIICSSSYGFYMNYCDNWKVQRCNITAVSYGMYVYSGCDYDSIVGNTIRVSSSYGLYMYNSAYAYGHYIVDNIITGWTSYGIYSCYGYNWKILYNTIVSTGSYALYQYYMYGDTIKDNIFQASSYPVYRYYGDSVPAYSDYNCYWTNGGSGSSRVVNGLTLAGWQASSDRDSHSIYVDPQTGGVMNPHLRTGSPCIGAGNPFHDVTVDVDGDTRDDSTPDIGADEYTTVGSAMSGTYYVKPGIANGDTYPSFFRANADFAVRGAAGNVTFEAFAGIYPEACDLTGLTRTPYWLSYVAHLDSLGVPDEVNLAALSAYGVTLRGAKRVRFRNINVSAASYGFYLYYDPSTSPYTPNDTIVIEGCQISAGSYPIYAYNYYGGSDDSIFNNVISGGSYGIYWYCGSSYYSYRAFIAQNMISGWSSYGIYAYYPQYPEFIYNTIVGTGSCALYEYYSYGDTLKDNILQASSSCWDRFGGDVFPAYSDYNCFWLNGGSDSSRVICGMTLAQWQAYSGKDSNSIQKDPLTGGPANPHLQAGSPCINAGDAWPGITTDIDGDSRTVNTPDIGADEYTSVGPPMGGVYTVKQGGGGDFVSISQAIDALALRGFGGDVQFDVYQGTYTGMYVLTGIGNGSCWLTFRAYPGEDVNLVATGSYNWYMIANKRIRIEGFTMTGATSYGLYMHADTDTVPYNGCDTCVIRGNHISGGSYGIYDYYADCDTIDGNTISSGSYCIYLYGYSTYGQYNKRNIIINNNMSAGSYPIMSYYQDSALIKGNTLTGAVPIYFYYTAGGDSILNNVCNGNGSNYGIYLYGYSSSPYATGIVIANNMLANNYYGMMIYYTQGCKVLYNSVQALPSCYYGLYLYYDYAMEIRDNIICVVHGGRPIFHYYGDYIENYNDLWVCDSGPAVICDHMSGATDMVALESNSGKDTGSISVDPQFVSTNDCHLQATSPCINAGDSVAGFLYDIDGDSRRNNRPDMGADEWVPTALDAGTASIKPGASIRPNPLTRDFAVLRYGLSRAGVAELSVYNVAGQRLMAQTLVAGRSGSVDLDLRHLSNGVYVVKFSSEGFASSQKLVVQR